MSLDSRLFSPICSNSSSASCALVNAGVSRLSTAKSMVSSCFIVVASAVIAIPSSGRRAGWQCGSTTALTAASICSSVSVASPLASVKRTARLFSLAASPAVGLLGLVHVEQRTRRATGRRFGAERAAISTASCVTVSATIMARSRCDRLELGHRLRRPAPAASTTASRSSSNRTGAWPGPSSAASVDAVRRRRRSRVRPARHWRSVPGCRAGCVGRLELGPARRQQRLDVALDVVEVGTLRPCAPIAGHQRRRRPGPPPASAGGCRARCCR